MPFLFGLSCGFRLWGTCKGTEVYDIVILAGTFDEWLLKDAKDGAGEEVTVLHEVS